MSESLSPDPLYLEAARRSISSNSSSTAPQDSILSSSELTIQVEEDYRKYEFSLTEPKPLPSLPSSDSDEFDPYLTENSVSYPSQSPIPVLTTVSQLAYALGPDNIPHTTEIDTVPCAGVRIPNGALTGLLAWRLVVRLAPPTKAKRGWWDTDRRNSYSVPMVHTEHYTGAPIPYHPFASISALSLPLFTQSLSPVVTRSLHDLDQKVRPSSIMLTRQPRFSKSHPQPISRIKPQPQLGENSPPLSNALAVNFILDTSLSYSIISRDTLIGLGYPLPSIPHLPNVPPTTVTLLIQNIPTRFHIARHNEASRLGVQFLHDAGVSVFFPKDGEGVGPVLYVESAHLLRDVPRTISLQRSAVKSTLPQRVRALFGFS